MKNDAQAWTQLDPAGDGKWFLSPDGRMMIYVDDQFRFHCWIAPNFSA